MTVTNKRRGRAGLTLGLLLAATVTGCVDAGSDKGGRASVDPNSITAMLGLVPDTPATRERVMVTLWAKVDDTELDIDPGLDVTQRELRRLSLLGNDQSVGTGMIGSDVAAPKDLAFMGALGFLPSDVDADIVAGFPPEQFDIVVGDFDAAEALDNAAAVDGATRTQVSDAEVVRWFDDYEQRMGVFTPFGRFPSSGRLTASNGVLAHDRTDAGIAAYLEAADGDRSTLDEVEELATVAEVLDEADVHCAYLSTVMRGEGGVLAPFTALGVGNALVDGHTEVVIVVVHASDDDAVTSEQGLTDLLKDPGSRDDVVWAKQVSKAEVTRQGALTIARLTTSQPTLWSQLGPGGDPLVTPR